jgi:glutathione S-transferase
VRWILFDNHKLTSYTATYRFMRAFVAQPNADVMAEFRKRAEAAWGVLDTHLAGRPFVVADRATIADLSLCGYLFWPDEIGVDWAAYPGIAAWLERIRALPRWRAPYDLMPGHPRPAAAA